MTAEAHVLERFARSYPAGTVLFHEGEPGHHMYVIQTGRVQLTRRLRGQEKVIAILAAGEFFGEMAIVNNRPRSATATVLEDATLLEIEGRTFEAMIRKNTEIAVRLIRRLSARLAQANSQIEVLLLKDVNHRVVHYLRKLAADGGVPEAGGLRVDIDLIELADRIAVELPQVEEALDKLTRARLLHREGRGIVISEVGRLDEFHEFLEMKDRLAD